MTGVQTCALPISQAVGNRALIKTMDELTLRTCLAILGNNASTHVTCRDDEHQKIVQAIETNDTKTATRLMLNHLKHIESSLEDSDKLESSDSLDELLVGLPLVSRKSRKK